MKECFCFVFVVVMFSFVSRNTESTGVETSQNREENETNNRQKSANGNFRLILYRRSNCCRQIFCGYGNKFCRAPSHGVTSNTIYNSSLSSFQGIVILKVECVPMITPKLKINLIG